MSDSREGTRPLRDCFSQKNEDVGIETETYSSPSFRQTCEWIQRNQREKAPSCFRNIASCCPLVVRIENVTSSLPLVCFLAPPRTGKKQPIIARIKLQKGREVSLSSLIGFSCMYPTDEGKGQYPHQGTCRHLEHERRWEMALRVRYGREGRAPISSWVNPSMARSSQT